MAARGGAAGGIFQPNLVPHSSEPSGAVSAGRRNSAPFHYQQKILAGRPWVESQPLRVLNEYLTAKYPAMLQGFCFSPIHSRRGCCLDYAYSPALPGSRNTRGPGDDHGGRTRCGGAEKISACVHAGGPRDQRGDAVERWAAQGTASSWSRSTTMRPAASGLPPKRSSL